jgi:hypothetical protein
MQVFKKVLKIAKWVFGIVLGILLIIYLGASILIGWGLKDISQTAKNRFDGDRVEALIALVDCKTCLMEDRNHAVWALGQLRDKRALPILHKYYNGGPCNHTYMICQYELEKAIRWTEGNSFMLPQIWRLAL